MKGVYEGRDDDDDFGFIPYLPTTYGLCVMFFGLMVGLMCETKTTRRSSGVGIVLCVSVCLCLSRNISHG